MPYSTFSTINHASSSNGSEYLVNAKEFIKDKLYFTCLPHAPPQYPHIHFFSIDTQLVYINFYSDFGPNNIAHVLRFCNIVQEKLRTNAASNKKLCLYSSLDNDKRANAAFLICAYMIIVHKKTPEEAYQPLIGINPPFMPYRDAGYGAATYHITVLDCIRGLHRAISIGLLDLDSFNLEQYEFYEKVENGDFNWITKKFLALATPKEEFPPGYSISHSGQLTNSFTNGHTRQSAPYPKLYSCYQIDNLIKFMLENNIKTIVRLNNKTYERKRFLDAGIEHIDLYFPDGTTPPDGILKKFLEICETREGPIAVHCKAGLGRTGTLIASYLMKHYKLTATETISFLRIIRPGSVVGPQQNYLQAMQARLWKLHPLVMLPPQISCWSPPGFTSQEALSHVSQASPFGQINVAQQKNVGKSAIGIEGDEMDIQSHLETNPPAFSGYHPVPTGRDFQIDSTSMDTGFESLFIPIQPRKNLSRMDEQGRYNYSSNPSTSMDQNVNNGDRMKNAFRYTGSNQAYQQGSLTSTHVGTLNQPNSRYNLRSAASPPGYPSNGLTKLKTGNGIVDQETAAGLVLVGGKIVVEKERQTIKK